MPTRGNKRKRLDTVAHMLATEHDKELYSLKPDIYCHRRSDLNARLSISGASFLDATFSPEKSLGLYDFLYLWLYKTEFCISTQMEKSMIFVCIHRYILRVQIS